MFENTQVDNRVYAAQSSPVRSTSPLEDARIRVLEIRDRVSRAADSVSYTCDALGVPHPPEAPGVLSDGNKQLQQEGLIPQLLDSIEQVERAACYLDSQVTRIKQVTG